MYNKFPFFLLVSIIGFVIHGTLVYWLITDLNDYFNSFISSMIYNVFTFPASLWYYLSWKYGLPGMASLPDIVTYSFWGIVYSFIICRRFSSHKSNK